MAGSKSHRNSKVSEMSYMIDAGANKIKKKIRDIERLLQKKKDTLPDTVKLDKERMLDALKYELKNARLREVIKKNAKKYHMIRFFEKKKAMRKYKNATKELKSEHGSEEAVQNAKLELCYVVNFPRSEGYIALYPNNEEDNSKKEKSKDVKKSEHRKELYLKRIESLLEEQQLPVSFENILKGKKLEKNEVGVRLEADIDDDSNELEQTGETKKEDEEEEDDFFE